eukprot:Gregarina_sp_Pseudo_9__5586@NODE_756_length_2263_cov_4_545414_g712_i0_p4_GENE_NODE_756_length_2263_cov_4_545414_g712_i0NODE_756_length_2263_cov_4_545414_g712_i0_p4_ORF_typecomplete_len120_score38_09DFRP_C/PF16543_5/1_9e03DFRP_C/PF16543_5/0_0048_NODE_756_length_2263_cov_4_545414_g712_i014841843
MNADKRRLEAEGSEGGSDESGDEENKSKNDEDDGRLADKVLVTEDCRVREEAFMAWREKFRDEMIKSGKWQDPNITDSRPTGKAYFLNISAKLPEEASKVFWQNEDLFDTADIDVAELE